MIGWDEAHKTDGRLSGDAVLQSKKRESELASKVSSMESEMQTIQAQAATAAQSAEDLKSQLAVRSCFGWQTKVMNPHIVE